eukprot:jgi/Antlo1/1847/1348
MANNSRKTQTSLGKDLDIIQKLKKKIESHNSRFAKKLALDIEKTYKEKKREIEELHDAHIKEITGYASKKYETLRSLAAKHEEKMAACTRECKVLVKRYEEISKERRKISRMISNGKSELKSYMSRALKKARAARSAQKRDLKRCKEGVENKIEDYVADKGEGRKVQKIFSEVFQ